MTQIIGEKIPTIIKAPVYDVSGYASHARDIILAMERSGRFDIRLEPLFWSTHSLVPLTDEESQIFTQLQNKQIDIIKSRGILMTISLPNEFQVHQETINIGVTAGIEVDRVSSQWVQAVNNMTATFVSSLHSKRGFMTAGAQRPIIVVGEGLDDPKEDFDLVGIKGLDDIETSFNFLSAGQWLSRGDRKGFNELIPYFLETFQGRKDVGLVLKIYTNNDSTPDFDLTKSRIHRIKHTMGAGEYPKIHLIHGILNHKQMLYLYRHPRIKAFVTLTHGECWGRHIAEAASAGLPLLVTGWGAHTEYLSNQHSVFLEYTLEDIPQLAVWPGVLDPQARWAVCDKSHVQRMMKRCVSKYDIAIQRAREQQKTLIERYGKQQMMNQLIEGICDVYRSNKESSLIQRV